MEPDDTPLPVPSPPSSFQDKLWRLGKSFLISLGGFVVGFLSTYSWEDGLDLVALKAAFFTAFGAWFVNTLKELRPEVRKLLAGAAVLLLVATLTLAGCHCPDDCCDVIAYRGDFRSIERQPDGHLYLIVDVVTLDGSLALCRVPLHEEQVDVLQAEFAAPRLIALPPGSCRHMHEVPPPDPADDPPA